MSSKRLSSLLFLFLLIASFYMAACQREKPESKVIIASFNGQALTLEEFNALFKETVKNLEIKDDKEQLNNLRRDFLNQLIERRLILLEAQKNNILLGDAELNEAVEKIKGDYPKERFDEVLKSEGLSYERWNARLREDMLIKKTLIMVVDSQIIIPDSEIKKYYNTHKEEFDRKAEVRVSQIVVAKEEEADEIRKEILSGTDFAKLAHERSLTPDKAKGGDLGFFSKGGSMPEEFDIAFSLKKGEISKVIKTPYGYHILKVEEKRPARKISYSEAASKIKEILMQEKREIKYREWLTELRVKREVKIDYGVFYEQ